MKTKNTMIAVLSIILLVLAGCANVENGAIIKDGTIILPPAPKGYIMVRVNNSLDLTVLYKDTISNQTLSVRYLSSGVDAKGYDYNIEMPR